jgi:hypothetical protein
MRRFDNDFEEFPSFGRKISFSWLEYFDVSSLHPLTIDLNGAKGQHNACPAISRCRRARRAIFENSNEIIFEQGTRLIGLKKKQSHQNENHLHRTFPVRCGDIARSVQQGSG